MLRFTARNVLPPGGVYWYDLPGVTVRSSSLPSLLDEVRRRAGALGHTLPDDLVGDVMDKMCRRLPERFCTGEGVREPVYTKAHVRTLTAGRARRYGRVSPATADERADICMGCAANNRSMCPSCSGTTAFARDQAGRVYREYQWLGLCERDGVALGTEVCLDAPPSLEDAPDHCWRRKPDVRAD